jgi:hypothetical protein
MKNRCIFLFFLGALSFLTSPALAQRVSLDSFLRSKLELKEKVILLYADESAKEHLEEQLNELFTLEKTLKYHGFTVVKLPSKLSDFDKEYLQKRLHVQADRLNVWVFNDDGDLALASTKGLKHEQIVAFLRPSY